MKKNILTILLLSSLALNAHGTQTPELGYWQRFKNWVSGTPTQAQEMAKIPYEWAKNFLAGFSEKEKLALAFALGVMTADNAFSGKYLTTAGQVAGAALIGKQAAISIMAYIYKYTDAKNLNVTIVSIKKDLSDSQKFPTLQSKLDTLKVMKQTYARNGNKPNKIAWQAVDTVLDELLKEKYHS